MVRKKPQSKRVTLKHKHKVERKVTEHNRKLRREARKNPTKGKKLRRDPGIPNLHPYKAQMLEKMAKARREMQEEQRQKTRREQALAERRRQGGGAATSARRMEELVADATARGATFAHEAAQARVDAAASEGALPASRAAELNRRSFFRHLKQVIAKADIVLEVLDARDPLACRSPEIENHILGRDASKRIILVLNKIDMVPAPVVRQWKTYLSRFFPTVAFKASTQKQKRGLAAAGGAAVGRATRAGEVITGSGAAGAEGLLQLIKNYARTESGTRSVTVGIIGYPNVGKSSIINSLKRSKAVGVSPVPGFTKSTQQVQLDSQVKLLDCPGIIFDADMGDGDAGDGGASLILRNCVSVDSIADPEIAVAGILRRCSPEKLMSLYTIPRFSDTNEFLEHVARARGKLSKGGKPNTDQAARMVLQDWTQGVVPFFTLPPKSDDAAGDEGSASMAIVDDDGNALDLDELAKREEEAVWSKLPVQETRGFVSLESTGMRARPYLAQGLTGSDGEGDDEEGMDDQEGEESSDGESEVSDDADDAGDHAPVATAAGAGGGTRKSARQLRREKRAYDFEEFFG